MALHVTCNPEINQLCHLQPSREAPEEHTGTTRVRPPGALRRTETGGIPSPFRIHLRGRGRYLRRAAGYARLSEAPGAREREGKATVGDRVEGD